MFNKITAFKNAVMFEERFHSISFRKKKQDCLSLPPKVYERQYVYMTAEQEKAYRMMESEALAAYEDLNCAAPFVITKYLRLSQIAGGIFPGVDADENKIIKLFDPNPKLERLVEVIDELPKGEQIVVWARFRKEIEFIYDRLTAEGYTCVKFYGGVGYKEKIEARAMFKDKQAQIFIGNPASGGKGLNDLIGATWVIYYSNDYSAENRQQSEDRNHRNGTIKVTYIDLITNKTIDGEVLSVLQQNKDYSDALLDRKLQTFLARAAQ
jgi:SNF2 family DNA or RNA helicase